MAHDPLSRFIVPGTDPDVVATYQSLAARSVTEVFGFEDEIVFVDVETTGFDPGTDSLIEVAAVAARGPEVLGTFSTLVKPRGVVPLEITALTGIDDALVADAPGPLAAVEQLAEFAAGRDIVAHNVRFDRDFLTANASADAFPGAWIDSLELAVISLPRLRSHRLVDLAGAFGLEVPRHRALDDAKALAALWRIMLCGLASMPAPLVSRVSSLAPTVPWALRSTIAHIAAATQTSGFDLKALRRARVSADKARALRDADDLECSCPPIDELAAEFEREGLAGAMYPQFERREEQARMAAEVLEAFDRHHHVAIEAGTGVGKSVAYLVPAARFAMRNSVGVGVATKTNALMDQLVYSELPALCRALDGGLRYVALKGYDHYPCMRKLDQVIASLDESAEERQIVTIAALMSWLAQTSWSDLSALNVHWSPELRSMVEASAADCTRRACRFYPNLCLVHGVRRKAASAHIVVTNHALLFRDVVAQGGILPPLRNWIVDEAHSVESEARKQLTLEVSHWELSTLLKSLASGRSGLLQGIRRSVRVHRHADAATLLAELADMESTAGAATTQTDALFAYVKELGALVTDGAYESCDVRLSTQVRESGAWGSVAGVGQALARKLDALLQAGRRLVSGLEALEGFDHDDMDPLERGVRAGGSRIADQRADLAGLLSRIADQREALITVIDGEAEEYVYSARLDRREHIMAERLNAARLDVGEALLDDFFPRVHSVAFTSATIATGDDFSHFARSVGLDRLGEDRWRALRLESSYDFERQMAAFVPNDLGDPRAPEYRSRLERLLGEIHIAMGGSVLTLFTNRRDMEAHYRVLAPRLRDEGLSLLIQGRGTSTKRLRDEFLADESLSLFATKSFWEGFDAKGDTLRCVVVTKLPFGRPTEPLAQERSEREGSSAWRRYDLPEAIIALKQAAGRLIRSSTDTGCLVITDSRVLTMNYGTQFLRSLPVSDIEVLSSEAVIEQISERFGHARE